MPAPRASCALDPLRQTDALPVLRLLVMPRYRWRLPRRCLAMDPGSSAPQGVARQGGGERPSHTAPLPASPTHARPSPRTLLRGNPRPHAAARGGRPAASSSPMRWSRRGFVYEGAKAFATPRRLALTVHGLPARSAGPCARSGRGRASARPRRRSQGFLKSAGLTSIDEAKVQPDPKKGDFYVAVIEKPGRPARGDARRDRCRRSSASFPWPKSMRWGAASARPGSLALGAAAALDPLRPSGPRPRTPRSSASRSTASRPATPPAAIASWRPAPIAVNRFDDYAADARPGEGRARRRPAEGHHPRTTPATAPSRSASSWSRTRGCSRRSPGSSNGRWC